MSLWAALHGHTTGVFQNQYGSTPLVQAAAALVQDMGQCVRCLAAIGRRLWVGLADGRIQVLAERSGSPGGLTLEEDWLAHEVSISLHHLPQPSECK